MWLDNLKELKKERCVTSKVIAEKTGIPERTVVRIFSGDTPNPYVDTLHRIVTFLGGSLDDILADTKAVVGGKSLATLQEENDTLANENTQINNEMALLQAELSVLKDKVVVLSAENDLLKMKLEHKEEIIALHNYYINKK